MVFGRNTFMIPLPRNVLLCFFKNRTTPASFSFFSLFKRQIYSKNVGVNGIGTRIFGIEGEHAYHLTTTTVDLGGLLLHCTIKTIKDACAKIYFAQTDLAKIKNRRI